MRPAQDRGVRVVGLDRPHGSTNPAFGCLLTVAVIALFVALGAGAALVLMAVPR